ncbi:DUF559 domain-containing protein [Acaryochloris sp. IP29b_bin.148]|uniref:DUF559 domain-containing protein n=1 Tax=Acaryochloris sp. IP29b_bin.148 TaxID=2969218 RepID=UPI0026331118|nr:DUF559 domain-containing protein [Acaryochloris sp. IP29b_bin.148]
MREKRTQHHRIRDTTPAVVTAARRLRLNLMTAEQKLWKALQKRQLNGLIFRCQQAIGSFVVAVFQQIQQASEQSIELQSKSPILGDLGG